jgi:hypothetical protein
MTPLSYPEDPIRQIENETLRDLTDEYRMLRLEQMIEKRRREVDRLKRGDSSPSTGGISMEEVSDRDLLAMSKELSRLPEAEREMVIRNYALLKAAEGSNSSMNYLPLLVGFAKANPGANQDQMLSYAKELGTQFSKGVESAQRIMTPGENKSDAIELMKIFKDLITDSVQRPLEEAIRQVQPQPGVFEQILTNPDLFARAKELGMFGRYEGGASTSDMDLKIEQLRTERDLEIKKIDLEWKKSMLEREAQDKRTDAVLTALAPLSAVFAGPVNQRMRQLGQQQASTHNIGNPRPVDGVESQEKTVQVRCDCGYEGTVGFQGSIPAVFRCPSCDKELHVRGGLPEAISAYHRQGG